MRICIPTMEGSGLEAVASGHFGSAPFFTVVDTESGESQVIPNEGHQHEHGICSPIRHLGPGRFEAVVCRGMGRRALASLTGAGFQVFVTDGERVADILEAARTGRLRRLSETDACDGGRHEHGSCR